MLLENNDIINEFEIVLYTKMLKEIGANADVLNRIIAKARKIGASSKQIVGILKFLYDEGKKNVEGIGTV